MKIGCSEVPKPSYLPLFWPPQWKSPAPFCSRMQFVLSCWLGTSYVTALFDSDLLMNELCFCIFVFATSHDLKQVDSTVRELPLKSHLFCAHARPQSSKEPLHLSTKAGWLEITVISCQVNFSFRMRIVRLWVSKVISPQNGSECHRKQWEGQKITRDKIFKEDFLERSERCLVMVDIPFSKLP